MNKVNFLLNATLTFDKRKRRPAIFSARLGTASNTLWGSLRFIGVVSKRIRNALSSLSRYQFSREIEQIKSCLLRNTMQNYNIF